MKDSFDVVTWASLNASDSDLEVVSLSCKVGHCRKINLMAVYRPPSGNSKLP